MTAELQEWAESISLWVLGGWIAGSGVVLVAVTRFARKAWPLLKDFVATVELFIGLGDRLTGIETTIETVRSQVQNSHGTNLRDDIDRNQAETREHFERLEERVTGVQKQVGRQDQRNILIAQEAQTIRRDLSEIETQTGAIDLKLTQHMEWSHGWSKDQEDTDRGLDDRLGRLEDTIDLRAE